MDNERQPGYNNDVCNAKRKALEIEINDNSKNIEKIEKSFRKAEKDLKSEIATTELAISNNLDKLDLTLRGNGKIGLQEQLRTAQKHIRILFACMILLFGCKLCGTGLNDIIKELTSKSNKEIKKVETSDNINKLVKEDKIEIKKEG